MFSCIIDVRTTRLAVDVRTTRLAVLMLEQHAVLMLEQHV